MLKNYLVIALRNVRRKKGYAFINVLGLSLGIAAALLIALFARNELTYDRFHTQAEDIYLVYKERITPTGTQETYDTWVPLLHRMQETFPAIVTGTREVPSNLWVQQEDKKFQEEVTYADPSLFDVFTFPLAQGDPSNPLPNNNAVVISQAVAQKYFGGADPMGRVLTIDHDRAYTVTGVLEEVPQNATLRPEIIIPITSAPWYAETENEWGGSFLNTYILLAEDAPVEALEAQFPAFITGIWDAEVASRTNFKLLPLLDAHDRFTGSRKYAYILLAVAFATILIACINFINLATARSLERAREVGMRKALGALRGQLTRQFLVEAVLMGLFGLMLGTVLAGMLLPFFNDLYEIDLRLGLLREPWMLAGLLGLGLLVGLISGSYPALFLSGFEPVRSLKGRFASSPAGLRLRHGLVVVQFALSIILIAGTVIMWSQVRYMKNEDLAFEKENVLVLPIEAGDFADPEVATARLETFKAELARLSDVRSVTSSSHIPGRWSGWFTFAWPEGGGDDPLRVRLSYMDARYFDTYGIDLLEGRSFIEGSDADRDQAVILNASAVRDFGWETGVGKTVRRGDTEFTVIGVVEDYHYLSLEEAVAPVLHFYRPPENDVHNFLSLRLQTDDYAGTLAALQAKWQQLDPTRAFDYFFVDENFDQLYRAQDRLVAVAGAFALLAILIACLGLFGLASLTVTQRTKEIGVRKVLGASVPGLTLLLSKDFARLVLIAVLIAAPVSYVAMNRWLSSFAYRIEIGAWVFLLAGLLALVIAVVAVSYQSIKAALADPVKSLRYE